MVPFNKSISFGLNTWRQELTWQKNGVDLVLISQTPLF